MPEEKRYAAFISSVFESLRDERAEVIKVLLDKEILPLGQEHFTVSDFTNIERIIDEADFFVLLMGSKYGSVDEKTGISWTEQEYAYAQSKGLPILVMTCEELEAAKQGDPEALKIVDQKQLAFLKKLNVFARKIDAEFTIRRMIDQFLTREKDRLVSGWIRVKPPSQEELEVWRNQNRAFDLAGTWYHVHLNSDVKNYVRIGTIQIEQDFSPDTYQSLRLNGVNYDVRKVDAEGALVEDRDKKSEFSGDYKLEPDGKIMGIFFVKRGFGSGSFGKQKVTEGTKRGIHDFLVTPGSQAATMIGGSFHDEAPSPKRGSIHLFRSQQERDAFALEQREEYLKRKGNMPWIIKKLLKW